MIFTNFTFFDFERGLLGSLTPQSRAITSQKPTIVKFLKIIFLIVRVRVIYYMFQLQFTNAFHDVSVSRNRFSKSEMRQFGASGTDGLIGDKFCPDNDR